MNFLDVSHSSGLVAASVVIALVAGFTGLSLTKDLSRKTLGHRKIAVALAAVALGGGIWSMHFVAMLGLQLPILFYYDAAVTLVSALLAILIVAGALILLHFTERTRVHILGSGALVGLGITVMHYVGMSALELCRAVYTVPGVTLAVTLSIALCVVAFGVAYHERNNRNILLGTVCFGGAVAAVHFVATWQTNFVAVEVFSEFGPVMSNEVLAIGVILSSFAILGAFLWVSTTYLTPKLTPAEGAVDMPMPVAAAPLPDNPPTIQLRLPCEREGGKIYILPTDVAFVRADGHYTQVYTETDCLFCSWSITEAVRRLSGAGYLQVHRSYVVNPEKVTAFERKKDSGLCSFAAAHCPNVPVSRSKLKVVQETLGV